MAKKEKSPKIGDKIYVDSSFYISHGSDDFCGGKATINKIEYNKQLGKDHCNYCMVGIIEHPGAMYNYKYLLREQRELKKVFGNSKAHPDPDIDTPWIEDGDLVNGEIYHGPDIW